MPEGLFSLSLSQSVAGVVESLKIITKAKSLRIAEYAFKLAQESGAQESDSRAQSQHHVCPRPAVLPPVLQAVVKQPN